MQDQTKRYSITHEKRSEARTDVYEIYLTVPKFIKLLKNNVLVRDVNTMKYSVIQVPDTQFQLKIRFLGRKNELMEIYYLSTTAVFLKSNLHLSLGNFAETYQSNDYHRVVANEWQYCATVTDPIIKGGSGNDTLYITCKIKVSRDLPICTQTASKLREDLGTLLSDGVYSDVTMKSAKGFEFKVHKNILAVRSNVLTNQLLHNPKILETEWETEVLRDVLIFIYTNTAPRVDNNPGKLLAAADYYQLHELKSLCENALCKMLTVENAIETLQLAQLYSGNTLREYTLDFIKEGRAKLIVKTEGWANIRSVDIMKIIYEFMVTHDNVDILAADIQ